MSSRSHGALSSQIGVEQVQGHTAQAHPPHRHPHRTVAQRHLEDARRAVGPGQRLDGRVGPGQLLVAFLLPAFGGDVLVEVTLRVHEPDTDERHPEVRCLLGMVARQHPEPAGVDRQGLVQRELGGEVSDGVPRQIGKRTGPPGVPGASGAVQVGDGPVVRRLKRRIGGGAHERFLRDHPQHPDRIVRGYPPERIVERPKDVASLPVPAPPQVQRELTQPVDAIGKGGPVLVTIHGRIVDSGHAPGSHRLGVARGGG